MLMKTTHAWWFGALALCAVTAATLPACGDDDDDAPAENAGSGGNSGKGGEGGKAGGGGKSGNGAGKGGTGGNKAAVECGGEACKVNSTLAMINPAAKACCTADDKCGQLNSAGTCLLNAAPGEPDTKCPDVVVKLGTMEYPQAGCCTPKGQCGGKFETVGYGCVARGELLMDMGGPLESIACGAGEDSDAGADAGE